MNVEKVISMVASMRTQAEILLDELMKDVIHEEEKPESEPVVCDHPPDYRLNLSTLGSSIKKWRCKLCGYEHEENM